MSIDLYPDDNSATDPNQITQKLSGLSQDNEKDYAQAKYDRALSEMKSNPTKENIEKFEKANAALWSVLELYRIGARLLLEYRKNHR